MDIVSYDQALAEVKRKPWEAMWPQEDPHLYLWVKFNDVWQVYREDEMQIKTIQKPKRND